MKFAANSDVLPLSDTIYRFHALVSQMTRETPRRYSERKQRKHMSILQHPLRLRRRSTESAFPNPNAFALMESHPMRVSRLPAITLLATLCLVFCFSIKPAIAEHDSYQFVALPLGSADFRYIPKKDLKNVNLEDAYSMLTAVNDWLTARGHGPGFPTFHQSATQYGAISIRKEWIAKVESVPLSELGKAGSPAEKFAAAHSWAVRNGYSAGLPIFDGSKTNLSIAFIKDQVNGKSMTILDLGPDSLPKYWGKPSEFTARFRKAHIYRDRNRFGAVYPNFYETASGNQPLAPSIITEIKKRHKELFLSEDVHYPKVEIKKILMMDRFWKKYHFKRQDIEAFVDHFLFTAYRLDGGSKNFLNNWKNGDKDLDRYFDEAATGQWAPVDGGAGETGNTKGKVSRAFKREIGTLFEAKNNLSKRIGELEQGMTNLVGDVKTDTKRLGELLKAPQSATIQIELPADAPYEFDPYDTFYGLATGAIGEIPVPGISFGTAVLDILYENIRGYSEAAAPPEILEITNPAYQSAIIDRRTSDLIKAYGDKIDQDEAALKLVKEIILSNEDGINAVLDANVSGSITTRWDTTKDMESVRNAYLKQSFEELLHIGAMAVAQYGTTKPPFKEPNSDHLSKFGISGFSSASYALYFGYDLKGALDRTLTADEEELFAKVFEFFTPREIFERLLYNDRVFDIKNGIWSQTLERPSLTGSTTRPRNYYNAGAYHRKLAILKEMNKLAPAQKTVKNPKYLKLLVAHNKEALASVTPHPDPPKGRYSIYKRRLVELTYKVWVCPNGKDVSDNGLALNIQYIESLLAGFDLSDDPQKGFVPVFPPRSRKFAPRKMRYYADADLDKGEVFPTSGTGLQGRIDYYFQSPKTRYADASRVGEGTMRVLVDGASFYLFTSGEGQSALEKKGNYSRWPRLNVTADLQISEAVDKSVIPTNKYTLTEKERRAYDSGTEVVEYKSTKKFDGYGGKGFWSHTFIQTYLGQKKGRLSWASFNYGTTRIVSYAANTDSKYKKILDPEFVLQVKLRQVR